MMFDLKNIESRRVLKNYIHFIYIQTVFIFVVRRKN